MEDVRALFREVDSEFTVFVVEQLFAIGRGSEYFRSFKGKDNLIDTNRKLRKRINTIVKWIMKRVPNAADVVKSCFQVEGSLDILDVITALSKLFTVETHQAAGPEVLDPIIIQEGNILPKYLNRLLHLHKESILRPVIIIILKDNDFNRAKELLANCPNKTNIKMIRNSGESILYRVVNTGAKDVEAFIDAFADQCFGTCSRTPRDLLLNKDWAEDSVIKLFAPELMKIRTNLLADEKRSIKKELNAYITELEQFEYINERDQKLISTFLCTAYLNRVFCNDLGGKDIKRALNLAQQLDNELLLAHTYRYAAFFPRITLSRQLELLSQAQNTFEKNRIYDHAIYCQNNRLIRQFSSLSIDVSAFLDLRDKAIYNVPGLVGMSHVYNNTGVALIFTGAPEDAIKCFTAGLDYAVRPERSVQRMAITSNLLLAKAYNMQSIDEKELWRAINFIFDNMGYNKLPFLSARYLMNLVAVAFHESTSLGEEIMNTKPIGYMVQQGLKSNILGSGQLVSQMKYLQKTYPKFELLDQIQIPKRLSKVSGIQKAYIESHGYNPVFFSTWL